jgi:hypothetical protein
MREFLISKKDLRETRIVESAPSALADGAVRLKLELFALTANNITYAMMGEGVLGYWDFFPGPEDWGRPPVWGFARVIESKAPGVAEGARFYGYYPISESFDARAIAKPAGFIDAAPHRAAKAIFYNQYLNTATDPAYDAAYEPEQTLFRPLYATGWWAADCINQTAPRAVIISSASSKTALATAHQLKAVSSAQRIGLTSARNAAYVAETGLYDRVIAYDDIASLAADAPAVYVDFLGRDELTRAVHTKLGESLTRSIIIGATDWADKPGGLAPPQTPLPGPTPEFFFVPTYALERMKADPTLGPAMMRDLRAFYAASRSIVRAQRLSGADAIQQSWARLAAGDVSPREGLVLSF